MQTIRVQNIFVKTLCELVALTVLLPGAHVANGQTSAIVQKEFLYKLQPTRADMLKTGPTVGERDAIEKHYYRLKELTKKGIVILAGRTLNTDDASFGIVIFRAASEGAACDIMNEDPAVKNGVMNATLFPFQVSLMKGEPSD